MLLYSNTSIVIFELNTWLRMRRRYGNSNTSIVIFEPKYLLYFNNLPYNCNIVIILILLFFTKYITFFSILLKPPIKAISEKSLGKKGVYRYVHFVV